MEFLLQRLAAQNYTPIENKYEFTSPEEIREACKHVSATILQSIFESNPDGEIRLFNTFETSYASWKNHVATSDAVRAQNWKNFMGWVRSQGHHDTCWAVVAAELISALRYIFKYDKEYTAYSAQFLIDYIDQAKGRRNFIKHKHYCFKYSLAKALEFVAEGAGIPREDHWKYYGCRPEGPANYRTPKFPNVHLASVERIPRIHDALRLLEFHPIGATLLVFEPDYSVTRKELYQGPQFQESRYEGLHAVSIYRIYEEDGETIAMVKSSHGVNAGDEGYFRVSVDVELIDVPADGVEPIFPKPVRLLSRFCFPVLPPL